MQVEILLIINDEGWYRIRKMLCTHYLIGDFRFKAFISLDQHFEKENQTFGSITANTLATCDFVNEVKA